jgi:hypothetical protein
LKTVMTRWMQRKYACGITEVMAEFKDASRDHPAAL